LIKFFELTDSDREILNEDLDEVVRVVVNFQQGGATAKKVIRNAFRDKLEEVDAIVGLVRPDNAACFHMCAEVGTYEKLTRD